MNIYFLNSSIKASPRFLYGCSSPGIKEERMSVRWHSHVSYSFPTTNSDDDDVLIRSRDLVKKESHLLVSFCWCWPWYPYTAFSILLFITLWCCSLDSQLPCKSLDVSLICSHSLSVAYHQPITYALPILSGLSSIILLSVVIRFVSHT